MDMWCYKYIARFALKGFFTVSHLFDDLTEPNSIILLQVDPTVAAKRKHVIKATEKGFLSSPTVPAFVEYQRKVANILGSLVTDRWTCVDSSGRPSEIVDSIENSILSLKELPRFDQSS
jgi:thymidylate kinase